MAPFQRRRLSQTGPRGNGHWRVIVFTRYPVPGEVKTRLVSTLGAEGAAALHRRLTQHTLEQVARYTPATMEVRYTGAGEVEVRRWLGPELTLREQATGDLGARMASAFCTAFDEGASRAVLVGCDCPDLGSESLEAAFDALGHSDAVLGPALDGGYYLVGLRSAPPAKWKTLFEDIDWGTERVLDQSLSAGARVQLRVELLAPLEDIDRPGDLGVWARQHDPHPPFLSVVIPTLNESARLESTVGALRGDDTEIIVADGGSTDGTTDLARRLGATCVEARGGRATQMNAGAARARGSTLLFLHADTRMPPDYREQIAQCLARPNTAAGAFRFKTDFDAPAMRVTAWFANVRASVFQLPYGDQGLFLRREVFRRAGGFRPWPIMEDFEFARRLRRFGRIRIAAAPAITRGSRWQEMGVARVTARNARIVLLYALGVPPERLAEIYHRRVR